MQVASTTRPLWKIAEDIRANWPKPYFGAKPYIDAMADLGTVADSYGQDRGDEIVSRFLCNAGTWRGDHAKRIKAELKGMIGR